jgi:hypothetical protein
VEVDEDAVEEVVGVAADAVRPVAGLIRGHDGLCAVDGSRPDPRPKSLFVNIERVSRRCSDDSFAYTVHLDVLAPNVTYWYHI